MTAPNPAASLLDFSHWPLLIARLPQPGPQRVHQWLAAMEQALQRQQPFVAICLMAGHSAADETADEKKTAAQWLQQHRQAFFSLCRGTVYVVPDDTARAALLQSARQQARASAMPTQAAATLAQALPIAQALLERRPAAGQGIKKDSEP